MAEKLDEYKKKRNFQKTSEPEGIKTEPSDKLKFVVQLHDARRLHYDFRLEWEGLLLSWAVPKGPSYNTSDKRLAIQVEDHPLEYGSFEGNIAKGEYGAGQVIIWDEGYWEPKEDMNLGLVKGALKFTLHGKRLKGDWALVRLKPRGGDPEKEKKNWLLVKEKDEFVLDNDGISEFDTSITTARTLKQIEEESEAEERDKGMEMLSQKITVKTVPDAITVRTVPDAKMLPFYKTGIQMPTLAEKVPEGPEWLYELKYDGYRIIAYLDGKDVSLISRNNQDYTMKFKPVADSLLKWAEGRTMVLDGEVVVFNEEGKTDFGALQDYFDNPKSKTLYYILFDLLAFEGEDLRGMTLKDRKEKLEGILDGAPANLQYSSHTSGEGNEVFAASCKANFEGIVCKKSGSVYRGTRNTDWLKVKCQNMQEFIICGYVHSVRRTGIKSLILGYYDNGDLVYSGNVGTGFDQKTLKMLKDELDKIMIDESPFKVKPKLKSSGKITWVKPTLIAEIKFAEWSAGNILRQPSYKGLRTDKNPVDVVGEGREEKSAKEIVKDAERNINSEEKKEDNKKTNIANPKEPQTTVNSSENANETKQVKKSKKFGADIVVSNITISNPDKNLFKDSGITKGEMARYYEAVASRMLPFVENRIMTSVRCPDGIGGECFFQKHIDKDQEGIGKFAVKEKNGEMQDYFYIKNIQGILSLVQLGTIEFHTWESKIENIEKPDMMVFDLDPEENMDIGRLREGVKHMKQIIDELSLKSYLKTSGGKGFHLVIPLEPHADWDKVRGFAKLSAELMSQRWPDRYTSNMSKDKRKNKIFVDWVRNNKSATSVAPYSIRARAGAAVSMPISWDELDAVEPDGFHMNDVIRKLSERDPWEGFYESKQKIL